MATIQQIQKLRRKIQDFYSKRTGQQLTDSEYAFKDEELEDIIDDAFSEVTDGARSASAATGNDEAMAMLLSRADAALQIAQDEARRVKWQVNNEIIDPEAIAPNLIAVAKTLQSRYENFRKRKLEAEIQGVASRPAGSRMDFNDTIKSHSERNFDNATVRRNRNIDHY